MTSTPLTVLDLVPISSGSTAAQALRNSIDLAQQAERLGYARYWFAEHHLNPGVAGTSPAVVLALTAGATSTIRLGSGAVQMGHRTALSTVEEFGLLDTAYPGRFDLGLGRSGGRPREPKAPALRRRRRRGRRGERPHPERAADPAAVLLCEPARLAPVRLAEDPAAAAARGAAELHRAGRRRARADRRHLPLRGRGGGARGARRGRGAADLDTWQQRRGKRRGRRPAGPAVRRELPRQPGHRARSGRRLPCRVQALRPSSTVPTSASRPTWSSPTRRPQARELATGYGLWVRSIRTAEGAIQFPTPEQARRHQWTDADRALVADRTDTQFVGTPRQVADQLERLRDATEADELIITTITHDHADRVRSYQLLADEWGKR